MKCIAIKILASIFYNSKFKKYNCNSTHIYIRNSQVGIPSYIIFHQIALSMKYSLVEQFFGSFKILQIQAVTFKLSLTVASCLSDMTKQQVIFHVQAVKTSFFKQQNWSEATNGCLKAGKIHIRRNNNKVNFNEIGLISNC